MPQIIFQAFQGLGNFKFKFHDFSNLSRICTNHVQQQLVVQLI